MARAVDFPGFKDYTLAMLSRSWPFALLLTLAAACSGTAPRPAANSVSHYFGRSVFLSPDGRLPYNKTETALKREVLEGGALVRETFTRPGAAPGVPPELVVIELRRREGSLTYEAKGSFSGAVTFKSPRLRDWALDLKAGAGGSMTGSGTASSSGYRVERRLLGVARPMLIKEELKAVSAEEHDRRVREFRPRPGTE